MFFKWQVTSSVIEYKVNFINFNIKVITEIADYHKHLNIVKNVF